MLYSHIGEVLERLKQVPSGTPPSAPRNPDLLSQPTQIVEPKHNSKMAYWRQDDWDSSHLKWNNQSQEGPLPFIQNADGKYVGSKTVASIRAFAKDLWSTLARQGNAPISWGTVSYLNYPFTTYY